jgi:RNA-binding protein YhbY
MEEIIMQLGKKGVTPEFITEIKKNIKARYLVRVRILKSALEEKDRFEVSSEFKELLPKQNVKLVGNVLIISK